jgi:peptide deformylase
MRNILTEGDPTLNKKCRVVTEYNARLHELLDDMKETLLVSEGVGLAAPQVGVLRRAVVVLDTNKKDLPPEEQVIELVNPEIISEEGEQEGLEGCLSIPGVYGIVKRPAAVTVRAYDRHGKEFEVSGEILTARAFCHEIDHLDGHLFRELAERILSDEELEEMVRKEHEVESDDEVEE